MRVYSEIYVDSRPLRVHIEKASAQSFGCLSPLGWTVDSYAHRYAAQLLLLAEPILPSGHCELLVCSECADLACGCISAEVRREAGLFSWTGFRHENGYDDDCTEVFAMGGFSFDAEEYTSVFAPYLDTSLDQVPES